MDILQKLFEPQYFYVTVDEQRKPVDMGYVPLSLAQELVATAQRAKCHVTLVVPNTTCH